MRNGLSGDKGLAGQGASGSSGEKASCGDTHVPGPFRDRSGALDIAPLAGRRTNASSRTGAALALALAAAAGAPAFAQSAPADLAADASAAPAPDAAPNADDEQGARPDAKRDSVFIFGRKVESSIATLPDPREAPQLVNVISGETLSEQGVTSLEQALRNVPGITTQIGEGGTMNGDQFFIRGFAAKDDIYTDGLRDFGVFTRDSFNYEQVEVLKGPSSTTLGRGTTGGGINSTSKTPNLTNGGAISLSGGSAEYERATADWNQVLGEGMAARINLMAHHQMVEGRDFIHSDRYGIAPSIGFGLDGKTSFTLAALYQRDDRVPDYGIPTANIPSSKTPGVLIGVPFTGFGVPSTNYYGYDADVDHTKVFTVTARLRHEVSDELSFTSDTKFGDYWRYFRQTVPNACQDSATATPPANTCATAFTDNNPATIPFVAIGGPGPYDQTTLGAQNVSTMTLKAPVAEHRNELLAGWDVSWQSNDRDQFNYVTTGPTARTPKNAFNPNHTPNPTLQGVLNNARESSAKDVSVFVSDRFWLDPQWSVSAGLRSEWYEFDQKQTNFTVAASGAVTTAYVPLGSNSQFTSPRVALIWEPSPEASLYASYATSATPPGITVSNGSTIAAPGAGNTISAKDLDPEKNTTYEIGAKAELFERFTVQASLYDTRKNNAKDIDPLSGALITSGDSQEAKGFELGLAGNFTRLWGFNFTYSYTDATTTGSATAANIGKQVQFVPKNAASLWSTYNFEGPLAGLQAGLGVTYQDRVFLNNANTSQAPSYVSLDGMISYGFDRYRLSLNAYNLTDELYFSQVNSNRVVPAPGRYAVATLGVAF